MLNKSIKTIQLLILASHNMYNINFLAIIIHPGRIQNIFGEKM